ncbi:hypothetical protein BC567DRAFT_67832 [Phyllosticta citribraziliensis]
MYEVRRACHSLSRGGRDRNDVYDGQSIHPFCLSLPLPFPSTSPSHTHIPHNTTPPPPASHQPKPGPALHAMVLPPLAILIPRLIRILELVVDVYGIVAPCVGCALRGCFGDCGCRGKKGEKDRTGEGGDDCPARPIPDREGQGEGQGQDRLKQERKSEKTSCFPWSSGSESKSKGKREHRKLHKDPPPGLRSSSDSPSAAAGVGEEIGLEADHVLAVLQQQYSTLPPPPTPPETPVLRPLRRRHHHHHLQVGQSVK